MLMELALTPIKISFFIGALGEGIGPIDIVSGTVPAAHHWRICAACMVAGKGWIVAEAEVTPVLVSPVAASIVR